VKLKSREGTPADGGTIHRTVEVDANTEDLAGQPELITQRHMREKLSIGQLKPAHMQKTLLDSQSF